MLSMRGGPFFIPDMTNAESAEAFGRRNGYFTQRGWRAMNFSSFRAVSLPACDAGPMRRPRGKGVRCEKNNPQAGDDMELRNSVLDFDLVSRLRSSSIASTVERGLSTLRSTQTRLNSSGGRSSSSLRVPER